MAASAAALASSTVSARAVSTMAWRSGEQVVIARALPMGRALETVFASLAPMPTVSSLDE